MSDNKNKSNFFKHFAKSASDAAKRLRFFEAVNDCDLHYVEGVLKGDPEAVKWRDPLSHADTALHMAALNGDFNMASLLIKFKADVNAPENFNNTPLIYAAFKGSAPVVSLLLKNNADASLVDNNGKTAFDVAKDAAVKDLLIDVYAREVRKVISSGIQKR